MILMLADEAAIDAVLGRGNRTFEARAKGRTIVNMATVSPGYATALDADIQTAGGRYVRGAGFRLAKARGGRPARRDAGRTGGRLGGYPRSVDPQCVGRASTAARCQERW